VREAAVPAGVSRGEAGAAVRRRALWHGTRFGLLLQLAVGPVCLFVLKTAIERGAPRGMAAVGGVVLVDALYIAVAGLGATRWVEGGARRALQLGGAVIIALFGLEILAAAFGHPLFPVLVGDDVVARSPDAFLSAALLTAANPLTIVFWAAVFSAKVVAERYDRAELWLFSAGCVLAGAAFLSAVALAGTLLGLVAPGRLLAWLNAAVGCALVYFAVHLALQRPPRQ
jgi:threonine/homoserine/homoserine lactone efflux protein